MKKLFALAMFAMFSTAAFASQSSTSRGSTESAEASPSSLTCSPAYKTCTQGCLAGPPQGRLECLKDCKANLCH